jgi:hypothetical protein
MSREKREDIEVEIVRLRGLDLDGLHSAWRAVFGKAAAGHIPKYLLLRILAYRLQAEAFGDLSRTTAHHLQDLASGEVERSDLSKMVVGRLRLGAILVREHDDKRHNVMVVEGGFAWEGKTYPSLSKVAFAITGTKWNGPRFFGLREKQQ